MIDIDKLKEEFDKYTLSYDPEQPRIALKIDHIKRVAENCKKLAIELGLSDEEIQLAEAIGYFHDIGRFEQVRIADTFSDRDSKINHAEKSVSVLFDDGKIREFIPSDEYDEIIKKAVLNHNRLKIQDGLTEKELLFAKIIRDADKLDIFYTITIDKFPAIFWYKNFDDEKISDELMNDFKSKKALNYQKIHTNADMIVIFYAYIFDIYFKSTLNILKEKKFLETFTKRVLDHFPSPMIHSQVSKIQYFYKDYLKSLT